MRRIAWVLVAVAAAGCDDGAGSAAEPAMDAAPVMTADAGADAAPAPDAAPVQPDAMPDAAPPEPPLPEVWGVPPAVDEDPDPRVVEVRLTAAAARHTLFEDLEVEGYAYNQQVPGPLIQARVGDEIVVHFTNDLPEPTTIHWHGLRIPDAMDGSPRIQDPVEPGGTFTYRFVAPEAGSFWYHPHVRTNEQLERGLYGAIVIRGEDEPAYDRERWLNLDDILVNRDGSLPAFLASHPEIMHGRHGNVLLTNGRADEVADAALQGDVERWRVVNSANARTMELTVQGARFRVIGTDGGPLREPYETERLLVPVGQRYDLEVSYDRPGRAELISFVLARDERGEVVEQPVTVFAVDVGGTGMAPRGIEWPSLPAPAERAVDQEVTLTFNASQNEFTGVRWTINGQAHAHEPLFTFREGETVRMRLVNRAGPEHPFHLHGQFFEIVPDGRPFTEQPGLKDTVLVPGLTELTIRAYLDNPGRWMAHCHILEHAELGMMSEIVVEAAD